MPAIMNEIAAIKVFFDSHQIHLSNDWLESCVDWCKQENLGPNYTVTELQYKIYEQWLLLDLRDIEIASLPQNLSTHQKFVLTGNYSVQVMQIVDISKPKLWQLDKIRNSNALKNNREHDRNEADTGKRVLLITFSDGVQEIQGMEYKPISTLNLNCRPGLKVRLMGPITIRRGRLMLEEKNIKVLGGEVEELVISNAAENVLARALNLPENANPIVIDENILTANNDSLTQANASFAPPPSGNAPTIAPPPNRPSNNNSNTRKNKKPQVKNDDLEEMRLAAEIDMLMEVENEVMNENPTVPPRTRTPDMFDDDFEDVNDELFNNAANSTRVKQELQSIKTNGSSSNILSKNNIINFPLKPSTSQSIKESITKNYDDLNELCDDVFGDFNLDVHLDHSSETNKIYTITELQHFQTSHKLGVYKIRASFNSIVQKLTVVEDNLYLVIDIKDNSSNINVRLHSDIIAGFAGYTPAEFMGLKSNVVNKDENATHKVIKALKDIREQLIKLNGIFEVQVEEREDVPMIIKIL